MSITIMRRTVWELQQEHEARVARIKLVNRLMVLAILAVSLVAVLF